MTDDDSQNPADLMRGQTALEGEVPADPGPDPEPGETIADRYSVFGCVGEGGMGTVYRVEDLELHELVALKLLDANAADDAEAVDQFRREVRLARRVAHRNVVRTYDYGAADGRPFLTMEYVDGIDLREAVAGEGLDRAEAISIGESVAAGLAEAHRVGIIHRDLKPENVLLGNRGRVAVSDFGIAGALRGDDPQESLNQKGAGTPAYMAPEQLRGREDMDHRVDVYAFGLLMFELLTGRLPWDREDALSTAVARLDDPPPSVREHAPGVSGEVAELVDACLRRDRDGRPQGFGEIERRLARLDGPEAASVGPEGGPVAEGLAADGGDVPSGHATTVRSTEREVVRVVVAYWQTDRESDAEVADGIRETLVYRLSYYDNLELRMRELGESDELRSSDPLEVGRVGGADVVVWGDVERDDDSSEIRASCRLVEVSTEHLYWSSREQVRPGHVRQVAARWAEEIAEELGGEKSRESVRELGERAHTLLMEGRHLMRKRWYDDIEPALKRLEAARDQAPDHPRTLSQLAVARARQAYLNDERRDEHVERSVELARDAIDAAGDAWAEPRYALAMAHYNGDNFGQAIATLRAALVRDPEFAEAHELLGRVLLEIGPLEHALEHLERALDLNPFLYRGLWDLMRAYGLAGEWEAVGEIAETDVDSEFQRSAGAMVALRMLLWRRHPALERFIEREHEAVSVEPFRYLVDFVEGASFDGERREQLEAMYEEVPERSRRRTLLCQVGAEMAAVEDRESLVYEYVDRGIAEGLTDVVWLQHCPVFDSIRESSEFQARVERLRERVDEVTTRQ